MTSDLSTRYAHYYLALSALSTLLFGCAVFDLGPLGSLSAEQSTMVVIALFAALTVTQSLAGR